MHIEDEFTQAVHQLLLENAKRIEDLQRDPINKFVHLKHEMTLNRLKNISREIDRTVNNLKQLPYTSFGIRGDSSCETFLIGITQPIYFADREHGDGDPVFGCLGKYAVAVPKISLLNQQLSNFHFVRMGRIRDRKRHFHHYALYDTRNPLDTKTETCWASMGPLMLNALGLLDVSLIFEAAYFFLTFVDLGSRLESPFYTRMTSYDYALATGQDPHSVYRHYFGEDDIDLIF
jgi:hypothetical protein